MGDDWADHADEVPDEFGEPDHDPEYARQESMNHIEEIITHYCDDITEWEAVNEVFHEPAMIEAIEGDDVTPETAEILGDWYTSRPRRSPISTASTSRSTTPTLSTAPHSQDRQQYNDQIDYLVNDRGVGLDGIGMQAHHYVDEVTITVS